nr:transposase [Candidatus Aquicultor secundus]
MEQLRQEMREKLNSAHGKAAHGERIWEIEPVIGNLKYNQKLTTFLCRGKKMVSVELGLSCTAHNLIKIFNGLKRKGVQGEEIGLIMRLKAA